ncbi:MAG: hypothetical protein ACRBCK_08495 [Alphaproteobacteria bacterium]
MAFTDKISYDRNQGFRTAAFAQPFLALEGFKHGKYEMVEIDGFTSNHLFETLEAWEVCLQGLNFRLPELKL